MLGEKKGRRSMYADERRMSGYTINVPSPGPVFERDVQPCKARKTPQEPGPSYLFIFAFGLVPAISLKTGHTSSVTDRRGKEYRKEGLTDIPRIVLFPPPIQYRSIRLPVTLILPSLDTPAIAVRPQCKSRVARTADT